MLCVHYRICRKLDLVKNWNILQNTSFIKQFKKFYIRNKRRHDNVKLLTKRLILKCHKDRQLIPECLNTYYKYGLVDLK